MNRAARFDDNPRVRVGRSAVHGRGLFARASIGAGEFIGRYDGPATEEDGMHVLWVEQDDGSWLGYDGRNEMRYLNHARPANCEMDGQDCYSTRCIARHEELTIDYGEDFEAL